MLLLPSTAIMEVPQLATKARSCCPDCLAPRRGPLASQRLQKHSCAEKRGSAIVNKVKLLFLGCKLALKPAELLRQLTVSKEQSKQAVVLSNVL